MHRPAKFLIWIAHAASLTDEGRANSITPRPIDTDRLATGPEIGVFRDADLGIFSLDQDLLSFDFRAILELEEASLVTGKVQMDRARGVIRVQALDLGCVQDDALVSRVEDVMSEPDLLVLDSADGTFDVLAWAKLLLHLR